MSEVEDKATALGWSPKEQFRGNPELWMDAETFVKRGEEIMPLLKANNRKLLDEVTNIRGELASTKELLKASTESIEALKEFNTDIARANGKAKKEELITAIAAAKEASDYVTETTLQDQLNEHNAALRAAEATKKATPKPVEGGTQQKDWTLDPSWKAWLADNQWFGPDKRRTALALGVANELRSENSPLQGRAFFDKVTEEVEKTFEPAKRNGPSRVEGGGSGTRNGGGTTYADLPADAKEACTRQGAKLVGKGRAFADQATWQKHYTAKYFEEA